MLFANIKKHHKKQMYAARTHSGIKSSAPADAGLHRYSLLIVNKSGSNFEGNFHIKIDSLHAFPMIQIREDDGLFFFFKCNTFFSNMSFDV